MWSVTIIVVDQIGVLIQYSIVLYSINWSKFIACIPIVCFSGCDVMNFEIDLIFLIKPFSYMIKKSRQKLKALRTKRTSKVKKKHFSSFLKGFQLPKIVSGLTFEWTPIVKGSRVFSSHCVKSAQIRNFFWSVFSRIRTYSVRMRKKTDQETPYLDTFYAVSVSVTLLKYYDDILEILRVGVKNSRYCEKEQKTRSKLRM